MPPKAAPRNFDADLLDDGPPDEASLDELNELNRTLVSMVSVALVPDSTVKDSVSETLRDNSILDLEGETAEAAGDIFRDLEREGAHFVRDELNALNRRFDRALAARFKRLPVRGCAAARPRGRIGRRRGAARRAVRRPAARAPGREPPEPPGERRAAGAAA